MRGIGALTFLVFAATLAACGGTNNSARAPALRWVLTSDAERLEFEAQPLLADLFNEAVRSSRNEGASSTKSTSPFLIIENGQSAVAPSFDFWKFSFQTPTDGSLASCANTHEPTRTSRPLHKHRIQQPHC